MTGRRRRLEEFLDDCVTEDADAGALRLDTPAERERTARIYREQSIHHRTAAEDHLEGSATLQAIPMGYYAMFHKANQAIARAGFDPKTHWCTLRGLRGVFNAPDLARDLQRAMDERENVDYRIDPTNPSLDEFASAERFLTDVVDPFLKRVDGLLEAEFGEP